MAAEDGTNDVTLIAQRRFGPKTGAGLPLEAELPGPHGSIWRFRQTIEMHGLSAALLSETNRQLDALGLIVSAGRWLTRR